MLQIKNLKVTTDDKEILKNVNLTINSGEIHVLMGRNGTGKSTICKVLMHHPDYIIDGSIIYNDKELTTLDTTEIARLGLFLLNQNPVEVEGITNAEMLRNVLGEVSGKRVDIFKFNKELNEVCDIIGLPKNFVHRDINFNMSGGEKKKNELLHLFMLKPSFIILDEIDSGLDVDALKVVGASLRKYYDLYHPSMLIVTHHAEILDYFDDYKTSILEDGKIIKTGDKTLVNETLTSGFRANIIKEDAKNE